MKIIKKSMLLIIVILFIAINVSSASPLDGNRTITVMSRNLYIGTDLGPIINTQNQTTLFEAIMTRFAEVQATNFSARAQALADEIAVKKPDLIGLQEVVLIRIQGPAATIEFDFLQILQDELAKRGQNYDIVAVSNGFNIEAPVILPDGSCCQNFQITDREVILARKDMETSDIKLSNVQERNFTNNLIVPILDHQFPVLYGWASVDVEVQGKSFRFITTHLESTSSAVQVAQANELLQDPANTTLPVVLVCDCNSNANGTGTDTYGNLIKAGFIDAWSQTHPGNPGFTCCQDGNLLNSDSNLSERIDLVLFRGSLNAIESDIVGENTSDRILSPSGLLWPSDHAGIVAKLSFSLENTIKLGAFNLQIFGPTKASNPQVMNVLSKIIRNYDVIAVEEIRDASQTALLELNNTVNSMGSPQYNYVVSDRLGRTTSKEQYAYFYNTQKIEVIGIPYVFNDSNDLFEREPFVANFKAKNSSLDFVSITIHTKPENATQEINNLSLVVDDAKNRSPNESDFIIMGDLNADCDYFDENSQSPLKSSDYFWIINNSVDTTTKSTVCTYDRIIITTPAKNDFTGDSGVFRFDTVYNLTYENTTAVSDHYPVYADFRSSKEIILTHTPIITGFPQETQVSDIAGASRSFNITANQTVDVKWYINGTEVFNQTGTNESSYTDTSAAQGTWNMTAVAQNANGSAMQKWTWVVNPISSETGSISGMKFNDLNNNSIKDTGEPGLEGSTILLTITGGSTETMTTDANGSYTFSNLTSGNYTVAEVLKPEWKQTFPANGTYNVRIAGGENLTGIDFGNNLPVTPPANVTVTNAVRIIEKESLNPGESTNITVDISSNVSQTLSLHEIIPAGWNLRRISDDADAFKSSTNEWIWFNVSPGINKTVIYRLTAQDNASIGTYHINGTISSASGVIAVVQGDNNINVTPTLPVRFTTDKDIYAQGEQVIFTLINNGTDVIDLPNSAPWWVENTTTGERIFSPYATQVIIQVGPGKSESWMWDQNDSETRQVQPGIYRGGIKSSIGVNYTKEFEISTAPLITPTPTPTVTPTPPTARTCLGDITGDSNVNSDDFVLFATAYDSASGDLKYNVKADMNNNGVINSEDFVLFASVYGKACSS
jgi:endonuclease/exonuclease/phosphatase family metal-dependent hydrolase